MNVDQLVKQLMIDEGFKLRPYTDTVGKLTIGVGRNLTDKGITAKETMYLLQNDVEETILALHKALPWWEKLDEVRQEVIANMAFNLGLDGLLTFHHTLTLVEHGKYDEAADAMLLSKWAAEVGHRADRLAESMRSGT